jgi:tRNA-specific 2-thiouridylase
MTRVLCALSGGVDSSVAALLLQEAGCDVVGLFMRNGVVSHGTAQRSCCSASDAADAARVADRLAIPFFAVDFEKEFAGIVDQFVSEYRRGRTPSPCILCNQRLKFGHLFELARVAGAEQVATGHYARTEDGRLFRAADRAKDQTYYLFGIPRERLASVRFPLGRLTKAEVRERARAAGLPVADKPESMEICFVPSGDYRDVVAARAGPGRPGDILDGSGRKIGSHQGIEGFTVGQRRGLPAGPEARYVVALDPGTQSVVTGARADLLVAGARLAGVRWLCAEPPPAGAGLRLSVKIRAQHAGALADVRVTGAGAAEVRFLAREAAVTPGQAAVFYRGEECVGGGWIDAAIAS